MKALQEPDRVGRPTRGVSADAGVGPASFRQPAAYRRDGRLGARPVQSRSLGGHAVPGSVGGRLPAVMCRRLGRLGGSPHAQCMRRIGRCIAGLPHAPIVAPVSGARRCGQGRVRRHGVRGTARGEPVSETLTAPSTPVASGIGACVSRGRGHASTSLNADSRRNLPADPSRAASPPRSAPCGHAPGPDADPRTAGRDNHSPRATPTWTAGA